MTGRTWALWLLACIAVPIPAHAAHPLQTEDTGTQGVGNLELENGFSRSRSAGANLLVYQPQVSYGVTPTVDFIVQPSWLQLRLQDDSTTRGRGDTNLDGKWRFFGDAPTSLGVRAGLTLPTSERGSGLAHGDVSEHALLVGTFDAVPFTIHCNIGVTRLPPDSGQRRWVGVASTAIMWAVNEQLIVTGEAAVASDTSRSRNGWPISYLSGLIWTARPGLDFDVGLQITRSDRVSRTLLVGATYRFAP